MSQGTVQLHRDFPRVGESRVASKRLPPPGHPVCVESDARSGLAAASLDRSEASSGSLDRSEAASIGVEPAEALLVTAEELFRRHAAFVATFVFRYGVAAASVDDVVQEVFITAHRRGGFQEGAAKATTWLAEIAVRVVSTHKRTERRRRVVSDEGALERAVSDAATPDETALHRAALARVQRALDALDDKQRVVFVLFELMGETCQDIARGLGVPVGTVHSRLFAARRAFLSAHERLERGPGHSELPAGGGA
jgi:RNA polymerase sigma-70 factor (ECF subfamily)